MSYSTPRLINAKDDLDGVASGEPELDDWLRRRSMGNQKGGASRTYVTLREEQVVGYYALATGAVMRAEATNRVGHYQPDPVPILLLARLAVDAKEQGKGLGSHLLRDAIVRSVEVADRVGVRALLVHALHETARDFYLHMGFEPSPTDPLHLFLLMKDARKLVGG